MSEPIKYEIKYKQALVKGSAKAGRTARKCEPPAIPCSKPKPVKACECLLYFLFLNMKMKVTMGNSILMLMGMRMDT